MLSERKGWDSGQGRDGRWVYIGVVEAEAEAEADESAFVRVACTAVSRAKCAHFGDGATTARHEVPCA